MALALARRFSRVETHRVEEAAGLRAALAERAWDVVLCDWTLPQFDGRAALAIVHEEKRELPVILVSSSIGEETTAEAMRAGARDFVLKNNLARLPGTIERALEEGALRAELSRQREEQERFFELAVDLLAIVGFDGRFKRVNPAWERTLGWTTAEVLATPWIELLHLEDRARTAAEAGAMMSTRDGESRGFESRLRCVDGRFRRILWSGSTSFERGLMYAVGHDITDRKDAEEALQRAHDELETRVAQRTEELHVANARLALELAERERTDEALRRARDEADAANRAKSAFLANMSHEIRTPMNAILGYTQLLERDARLERRQQQSLAVIRRSGEHLLTLINDVLEMSKIEAGHRRLVLGDFDVWGTVDDLERTFRLRVDPAGPSLHVSRSSAVPRYLHGDEAKLRQVLANLIGNALKFTDRGTVMASLSVRAGADGADRLVADIADTGPGMTAEEVATLFQPFVQTRVGIQALGGTGLGLALSREFARLMGGDITVESRPGQGSSFRVDLPIQLGSAPSPPRAARRAGRVLGILGSGPPWRTLLVDDDADNRSWLSQLLAAVGFEVREASDGAEALAAVEAWAPQVVLVDLNMPVMDGYDAMRAIRALPSRERVVLVAVTASAFDDARDAIFAAGADGWLRKPCREADLLEEIRRHTGIEYRYADDGPSSSLPAAPRSTLSPRALALELRGELVRAALIADYDQVRELIGRIPPEHAHLAEELDALVERFAYEQIVELLRGPP